MMTISPILKELYTARAEIMAKYGNDLGAYLRDAAERAKTSDHPIAEIKQRRIRWYGTAASGETAALEDHLLPPSEP